MTIFDKIVSQGPEFLAKLLVDSKIKFTEGAVNSITLLDYKTPDELRDKLIKEHYNALITELEE